MNAAERGRDRVALGIFAVGAFLYGFAWLRAHNMAAFPILTDPTTTAVHRVDRLAHLSKAGLAIAAIGAVAMLWSFWHYQSRPKDVT